MKPRYVKEADGQHLVNLKHGYFYASPILGELPVHPQVVVRQPWLKDSPVFIHHYTLRDERFLYAVKLSRYSDKNLRKEDYIQRIRKKYNTVTDTSMHRFVPELKRRMAASAGSS